MPSFTTIIQKFANKGEKTGWRYVDIPPDIITCLKLKNKKEFRIKGAIDDVKFDRMACYPIGDGNFIIALNAELRKKLKKDEGAMVSIKFSMDKAEALQSAELLTCLAEDAVAGKHFDSLLVSHKNYFHRYVYTAKGDATKAARIVNIINAMYKKQNFGEMIRELKQKNKG
ncbi:MAG: hypothetical protein JWO32_35 [Bacteroidetes bacterium]|nr:hypothetical protein [Bacteroidota bacterium]